MTTKNYRVRPRTLTKTELLRLLKRLNHCVALVDKTHDAAAPENQFDIFSGEPLRTSEQRDSVVLRDQNVPVTPSPIKDFPFVKGWIGACAYESDLGFYGYYTWCYCYSHSENNGYFVFSDECDVETEKRILDMLASAAPRQNALVTESGSARGLSSYHWAKSQSFEDYAHSFARLQEYILSGDCYQANLTQRFEADCTAAKTELLAAFFADASHSQAGYCAFIEIASADYLISLSPEKFIEANDRHLKSMPIKGTVKSIGKLRPEDRAALLNEKNRAENLMIVDLLRNDMSKVSKLNSVKVSKLFAIESYENVHHLVSTIESELKEGLSEIDAFWAAFPGGSITGTPKKRAMEIIEELEVHSRRYYCGSIFYWDFRGKFNSSILIRTAEKLGEKIYCWAGGGIVADSQLEAEYQESLDKVRHITGIEE